MTNFTKNEPSYIYMCVLNFFGSLVSNVPLGYLLYDIKHVHNKGNNLNRKDKGYIAKQ